MTYKKYILPAVAGVLALGLGIFALLGREEPEFTIDPVDPDPAPVVKPEPTPTPDPVPTPTPEPQPQKYRRPDPEPGLCWSLEVARLDTLNPDRPVYGIEFLMTEDKDGYNVEALMGDCDKITGIRLYPDRIEVWLDGDYKLFYGDTIPAYAQLNQPEKEAPQETAQTWELREGQPGEEHVITVKFDSKYPAGTLFNLRFSYGKLD